MVLTLARSILAAMAIPAALHMYYDATPFCATARNGGMGRPAG